MTLKTYVGSSASILEALTTLSRVRARVVHEPPLHQPTPARGLGPGE